MKEQIERAESCIASIQQLMSSHTHPTTLKQTLVVGFIDQALEHHAAVMLLIKQGLTGSAFALARVITEIMYRTLWIATTASDGDIDAFVDKDKIPLSASKLAELADKASNLRIFANLKNETWSGMNSYTHTGVKQLERRFTSDRLEPSYPAYEISQLIKLLTVIVLVLTKPYFQLNGADTENRKLDLLAMEFCEK